MKKLSNIVGGTLFYSLLPAIFLAYIIHDTIKRKSVELAKTTVPPQKFYTCEPEHPTKDFSEWAEYIHRIHTSKYLPK